MPQWLRPRTRQVPLVSGAAGPICRPPPVVYVTSSGDTRVAVAALKAGAADYVPKDVAGEFLELLATAIEGAIEQARLRREKSAAEEAVREERDRAEMLLREVNHRVGNSLALVAALVRMQSAAVSDPAAVEALKETQARITAIAGIHRRLYTSDDVRFVDGAPTSPISSRSWRRRWAMTTGRIASGSTPIPGACRPTRPCR